MPRQPFVGPPCSIQRGTDLALKNKTEPFFFLCCQMTVIHVCLPPRGMVLETLVRKAREGAVVLETSTTGQ